MIIKCEDLLKKYNKCTAIDNLNLTLDEDKIYCLLGKNGAGKTTFLKLISGYIPKYQGKIFYNNMLSKKGDMNLNICYIPDKVNHFNLSVNKLLELSSSFYAKWDFEFMNKIIASFNLDANKKYKNLSLGMKAMVNIIIGLCSNTEVLIFDEVTCGCDSIVREKFYDFILEAYERKPRTMIISTHLIDEISKIAEKAVIFDKGNVITNCDLEEIRQKSYAVIGETEEVENAISNLNVINRETHSKYTVATIFDNKLSNIEGNVTVEEVSLQKLVTQLVGGDLNE